MRNRVAITGYAYHAANCQNLPWHRTDEPAHLDHAVQIPNRSDRRAQGPSQLLATYTAGEALEMASIKDNNEILDRTDVMVSVHSGERDDEVDLRLFKTLSDDRDSAIRLNRELANLRPSLFLTQLQNLFAANISMVFGVLGMSVTFIGETHGGIRAVKEARARIRSSRSQVALVGGVFNGSRNDLSGYFPSDDQTSGDPANIQLGHAAGFIVLEDEDHAISRGAEIKAILGEVDYPIDKEIPFASEPNGGDAILADYGSSRRRSCQIDRLFQSTGHKPTVTDLAAIAGQLMEASFPFAICLATEALNKKSEDRARVFVASVHQHSPAALCAITKAAAHA